MSESGRRVRAALAAPMGYRALMRAFNSADPLVIDDAIRRWERILADTSPTHAAWAVRLSNLGTALHVRYGRFRRPADLDAAIDMLERSLAAERPGREQHTVILNNLGNAIYDRYKTTGRADHLVRAVDLYRAAAAATWRLHVERSTRLSNLGIALQEQYSVSDDGAFLDESIEVHRQAVAAAARGSRRYASALGNLGNALSARSGRRTDSADIDEAVEVLRERVRLTPDGHAGRPGAWNNLGIALSSRYDRLGRPADLAEATEVLSEAVRCTADDDPDLALYQSNLAGVLEDRFAWTDDPDDLAEAERLARAAIRATNNPGFRPLSRLSMVLTARFERHGRASDLTEAIDLLRDALAHANAGQRSEALHNLANALYTRFGSTHAENDLSEAVELLDEALTSADAVDALTINQTLSVVYLARFDHLRQDLDLDRSIAAAESALRDTPVDHADHPVRVTNLANALHRRAERDAAPADLTKALELQQIAVDRLAESHPYRPAVLNNLGIGRMSQFGWTGRGSDLDAAIDALDLAVDSSPAGSAASAGQLGNLANALRLRFEYEDAHADIDRAVAAARAAVAALPADHADLPNIQGVLGAVLQRRSGRLDSAEDLTTAVRAFRTAADILPADDPERAQHQHNLGVGLSALFERSHDRNDLTAALDALRTAVRLDPCARNSHTLAVILHEIFEVTGEARHLDEAIDECRRALDQVAPDPDRARVLASLGDMHATRHRRTGEPADRDLAVARLAEALSFDAAPASMRIDAARVAADLLAATDPARAADLLSRAVGLLRLVTPRRLERSDQQHALSRFAGLAGDAAALTLLSGNQPAGDRAMRAVQLLETGRGVLLGQSLDLRTDVSELRAEHPGLAERFVELRDLLDQPSRTDPRLVTPVSSTSDPERWRRRSAEELAAVITEIQARPGFAGFGRPPRAAELLETATSGPIVLVNVSRYASHALLLTGDGVETVALPGLPVTRVSREVNAFHAALQRTSDPEVPLAERLAAEDDLNRILSWLWREMAEPILRTLAFDQAPATPLQRLWWAPGGLLGLLPLHAAGEPGTDQAVFDRVVSSYTPTVQALRYARQRVRLVIENPVAVGVAMPVTDGEDPIRCAVDEVSLLRDHFSGSRILTDREASAPTRANVLVALHDCDLAHFACHAMNDPVDPSRSQLLLKDHRTDPCTVASLTGLTLPRAQLVYLSACHTALTDTAELIDEAIHLASALHLAGFPHVIGTLWELKDTAALAVARAFYDGLAAGDTLRTAQTPYALHAAVLGLRATFPANPALWAAYLHVGA
jgi:tetratricopeptide (TPR) repeat protein